MRPTLPLLAGALGGPGDHGPGDPLASLWPGPLRLSAPNAENGHGTVPTRHRGGLLAAPTRALERQPSAKSSARRRRHWSRRVRWALPILVVAAASFAAATP